MDGRGLMEVAFDIRSERSARKILLSKLEKWKMRSSEKKDDVECLILSVMLLICLPENIIFLLKLS